MEAWQNAGLCSDPAAGGSIIFNSDINVEAAELEGEDLYVEMSFDDYVAIETFYPTLEQINLVEGGYLSPKKLAEQMLPYQKGIEWYLP